MGHTLYCGLLSQIDIYDMYIMEKLLEMSPALSRANNNAELFPFLSHEKISIR